MPEPTAPALIRDGHPLLTRDSLVRGASYNPETRTVPVSLGTGAPVERYDWRTGKTYIEVLSMDPAHIRLTRLNGGAPFLTDHNSLTVAAVVGRFVRGTARIEGGELIADVRLSRAKRHEDTVGDIVDGVLADTSVGYVVHTWDITRDEATGIETRTATDWEPYEGSVVPIPADPSGGIRSPETAPVTTAPDQGTRTEPTKEEPPMSTQMNDDALRAAREEGAKAEAARQTAIRADAAKVGLTDADIRAMLDDANVTADAARGQILDLIAARAAKDEVRAQVPVTVTRDEGDNRIRALTAAVEHKAGLSGDLPDNARDYRGATLLDIARARLSVSGIDLRGYTPAEIAGMALHSGTRGSHTSSDFPYLLANTANKVLRAEADAIPEYLWFTKIATRNDFPDFKVRDYPALQGLGTLPVVPKGAEYVRVTMGEGKESAVAVKRGAEFALSMEMIVNDDLGGFLRIPRKFGRRAITAQSEVFAGLLSTPQTMGDGLPLFDAAHDNLSTDGGQPDVDRLAELDGFLRAQTDNGTVVGLPARYLFLPGTWRQAVEGLFSDRYQVTDPDNALTVDIPKENRLYVPNLTGTAYFAGTGDPMAAEYGYLAGDGGPVVEKYVEEKSDAVVYHARLVFGAVILESSAFAKNPGA